MSAHEGKSELVLWWARYCVCWMDVCISQSSLSCSFMLLLHTIQSFSKCCKTTEISRSLHYIYDSAAQRRRLTTRWAGVSRRNQEHEIFHSDTLMGTFWCWGNKITARRYYAAPGSAFLHRLITAPYETTLRSENLFCRLTFCGREYNVKSFINASDRGNHRGAGSTTIKPEQTGAVLLGAWKNKRGLTRFLI